MFHATVGLRTRELVLGGSRSKLFLVPSCLFLLVDCKDVMNIFDDFSLDLKKALLAVRNLQEVS